MWDNSDSWFDNSIDMSMVGRTDMNEVFRPELDHWKTRNLVLGQALALLHPAALDTLPTSPSAAPARQLERVQLAPASPVVVVVVALMHAVVLPSQL